MRGVAEALAQLLMSIGHIQPFSSGKECVLLCLNLFSPIVIYLDLALEDLGFSFGFYSQNYKNLYAKLR